MSGADKYRLYTRLVLQSVLVGVVVMVIVAGTRTWSVVSIVIAGIAAIAGIESQPDLAIRATERQRAIAWRFSVGVLAAVWLVSVILANVVDGEGARNAALTASFAFFMASASVLPFVEHRWWLVLFGAVASTLLLTPHSPLTLGPILFGVAAVLLWTSRMTVWGLQVITDLEHSKQVEAELTVAQERLRFSRDLHDVVGRAFSAVAVKSELAATLARAGATDRAATEMDEVKALAVTSLEDARALVRGYRNISLGTEVAGARSLLSAAGCGLRVIGTPGDVPAEFHEAAAWVVREGTTNIVKHSSATQAVLTLSASGLVFTNDGASGPDGAPSGIEGLRGRLRAVGAGLDTARDGAEFTLTATWAEAR